MPFSPTARATVAAVNDESPVTMSVRTAIERSCVINAAESERGGSLRAMKPDQLERPFRP